MPYCRVPQIQLRAKIFATKRSPGIIDDHENGRPLRILCEPTFLNFHDVCEHLIVDRVTERDILQLGNGFVRWVN